MRRVFHVDELPDLRASGVSHGVETDDYVFVASMAFQFGASPARRDDTAVTIEDEVRICLDRMNIKLQAVGCDLSHVVKMTVYLSDRNYAADFQKVYREYGERYWPDGTWPMRTTHFVGVARDCRVELDAIAVKKK
jgi:2-iminobutanoate/2-iminopropanoate deaminase